MTPQLQQAIKMLQLSNLELGDFVDGEIQQNPLLERQDRGSSELTPHADIAGDVPSSVASPEILTGDFTSEAIEQWQPEWGDEGDRAIDFGGEPQPWRSVNRELGGSDRTGLDGAATRLRTLREHVLEQIGTDLADPGDRVIALHLLDLLDEAGYLHPSLDSVARLLGTDLDRVEAVLGRLQQFDPPGVFARDLKECLALQLRDRNRLDRAMQALPDNLELFANGSADDDDLALVRICGVDAADMAGMIRQIQSLGPKPGHACDPPLAPPVVPDILMRAHRKGGWVVELNAETLPRVLVNNRYYARVRQAARSKTDKDYLTE